MTAGKPSRGAAALHVRLYLAGRAPNSLAAEANFRALMARHSEREIELELIDVLANPQRGFRDGVLATPTLVKIYPSPEIRVVGNLRDQGAWVAAFGLEDEHGG